MSDAIAMLIADDPVEGYGFTGNCNYGLRTADNAIQYPCFGEIHDCGQLLSGAIWRTRNALKATHPADYLDILSNLTVNSILLHAGSQITPQIAIDFLTLDDDDGNLDNGTPHRSEICAGFGAHNLQCPPLPAGLGVDPPDDFEPSGPVGGPFVPASVDYTVENQYATPIDYEVSSSEPWLSLSSTGGRLGGHETATVTVSLNGNAASLPAGSYSATLRFTNATDHVGDTIRWATLTPGGVVLQYEWTLDANPGWSTEGLWSWGRPTGGAGTMEAPTRPAAAPVRTSTDTTSTATIPTGYPSTI